MHLDFVYVWECEEGYSRFGLHHTLVKASHGSLEMCWRLSSVVTINYSKILTACISAVQYTSKQAEVMIQMFAKRMEKNAD